MVAAQQFWIQKVMKKTTTKTATGNNLLKAYSKAVKKLQKDKSMTACLVSAGFIIPDGQKKGKEKGFQVFVKVHRYSEELFKRKPITGGLI